MFYGARSSSDSYIAYLRSLGMRIGEETVIYAPRNCVIDETRAWMITMGRNVQIAAGVTILTHGYDWSVFKGLTGEVLGSAGKVVIGDNVFIGMNTTILKGTTVGSNVVIGANSLISKDVPDNCVVAGNPQQIVMGISQYHEKRKKAQLSEAAELYDCYCKNVGFSPSEGALPPKEIFREFFWLFEPRGENGFSCAEYENVMRLCGTYDLSAKRYEEHKRMFSSYEEFVEHLDKMLGYTSSAEILSVVMPVYDVAL